MRNNAKELIPFRNEKEDFSVVVGVEMSEKRFANGRDELREIDDVTWREYSRSAK